MDFSFNSEVATVYGVPEAVLIHNLFFWIEKNRANEKHYYEGKYWTYNTIKAFSELFPFWTESQIRRLIKKLEDAGAIEIGNFNKVGYDRTQWYALTLQTLSLYHVTKATHPSDETVTSMCRNRQIEVTESSNRSDEIVTPIPDINTDSKPDSNTTTTGAHKKPDFSLPKDLMQVFDFYENNFSTISQGVSEKIRELYASGMEAEVLLLALEKSLESGSKNWNYARGILERWEKKGIKTREQVEKETSAWEEKKRALSKQPRSGKPKSQVHTSDASYDLKEFEQIMASSSPWDFE